MWSRGPLSAPPTTQTSRSLSATGKRCQRERAPGEGLLARQGSLPLRLGSPEGVCRGRQGRSPAGQPPTARAPTRLHHRPARRWLDAVVERRGVLQARRGPGLDRPWRRRHLSRSGPAGWLSDPGLAAIRPRCPAVHPRPGALTYLLSPQPGDRIRAGLPGMTGVWSRGAKVAAIGVKLNQTVTSHGFALNLTTDLGIFNSGIVPCGLVGKRATSVLELGGPRIEVADAARGYPEHFGRVFGVAT